MKIKINDSIIKKAAQCRSGHSCLDNPDGLCPVKFSLTEDMVFVNKPLDKDICNYYVPFGYGGFCDCPVRKSIYREYNK